MGVTLVLQSRAKFVIIITLIFVFKQKENQIAECYQPKRRDMLAKSQVTIPDVLAARDGENTWQNEENERFLLEIQK